MSAVIKWRNLSVPQRAALRHLVQAGTATIGYRTAISDRCALALVKRGAAVAPGFTAVVCAWDLYGKTIKPTEAGRAAVAAADAYLADPAAVSRARAFATPTAAVPAAVASKSRTPRKGAAAPAGPSLKRRHPGIKAGRIPAAVPADPGAKSRTPGAAVRGSRVSVYPKGGRPRAGHERVEINLPKRVRS